MTAMTPVTSTPAAPADDASRRARIEAWDAMGIGPYWLLRETPDPLVDPVLQARQARPAAKPAAQPALATARPAAPARPAAQAGGPACTAPFPGMRPPQPTVQPVRPAAQLQPFHQNQPAAPASPAALLMPPATAEAIRSADWDALEKLALGCACCPMAKTRQNVVFAEGRPGPGLVIVGEAPGGEEDLQGIPFVGKSGKLLTSMLDALNIVRRQDAVIVNVLKCRPPGNRDPQPAEIACCTHFLRRQIELLKPKAMLLMGRFAAQTFAGLQPGQSMKSVRGRVHLVHEGELEIQAVATYHPSYLLRSPDAKAKAWEDLVLLKRVMAEAGILPAPKAKSWG